MNAANETEETQKLEAMKKTILVRILSKDAYERLGRIRLVKSEMAGQLELYLVQLYQSGKISNVITDEQLKGILDQISSKQKFRILK